MMSEGLGTDSWGHKNGFWDNGEKGYCNTFYIFQDNVQCVFMSNSMYTDDMTWPEAFVEGAHRRTFG
jgi:hypothetical protein